MVTRATEAETAAQMGAAISRFWLLRGYMSEGRRWLERTLSGFSEKNAVRVKALNLAAILASLQDDYTTARTLAEECLEVSRELAERQQTGYALYILGRLARIEGNYAGAVIFLEESLALFRELTQKDDIALVLSDFGLTVLYLGDYERATALCEQSLALSRELGDLRGIASWLANLAIVTLARGEARRATEPCDESLAIRRALGYKGGCAHTLAILGRIALTQDLYERATVCYQESLTLRQETGEKEGIATALEGLAAVTGIQGEPVRAARLYGFAESLRTLLGAPLTPIDRPAYQQTIAALQAQLDEPTFLNAWAAGMFLQATQRHRRCTAESGHGWAAANRHSRRDQRRSEPGDRHHSEYFVNRVFLLSPVHPHSLPPRGRRGSGPPGVLLLPRAVNNPSSVVIESFHKNSAG